MELSQVRYFLALCRTLNFSRAADQCNVTQPALTRAIQKLEHEIGGLLFARERGNTHLTELGRLLEPKLAIMVEQADAAKSSAGRFLRLEGAQMTLGVMRTIGPGRFVSFLNDFCGTHPGIALTLVEADRAQLSGRLMSGEIDIAIMAQSDGFASPLQARPLYSERFVVAFGRTHRFAMHSSIQIQDLEGEVYLQRTDCEYCSHLADRLAGSGIGIVRSYRSEREDWIQSMAAAGVGICLVPEFITTVPGLLTRRMVQPDVVRSVCLVTVAGRRWSSPAEAFVNAARAHAWSPRPPARSLEAGAVVHVAGRPA
jgi:DNA-binding transcriptional LysR family regulator